MQILHKFIDYNWNNGFYTKNSILYTPYKPETFFIGTFNHGWDWNYADFFYGRDRYMWPILANLFLYNRNRLILPRNKKNPNPSINEIFEICNKAKIAFADVVRGVKSTAIVQKHGRSLVINDSFTWDNYSDKQLNTMAKHDWLDDQTDEIIKYINQTPSIKHIYFTFNSEQWLIELREKIISNTKTVSAGSIFTPTGMGFRKNLIGFEGRVASLTHCWIWNGLKHYTPVNKKGYTHLNHQWLREHGVDVKNF